MRKRDFFSKDFKAIYPEILKRDNNRCIKCGQSCNLEIHHVNGYEDNNPENLKTLCFWCHGIAPMGEDEFDTWLRNGKKGREQAKEYVINKIDTENIGDTIVEDVLSAYDKYRDFSYLNKLKVARERKRAKTGKCEGRKSYSEANPEIVKEIKRLRRRSKNRKPMSFSQIAAYLNDNGHRTLTGGLFTTANVQMLLKRSAE